MRAERVDLGRLGAADHGRLVGAVLLAPFRCGDRVIAKGTRLDAALIAELTGPPGAGLLRLAWPDPGDLHEDEAARRLAIAVAGAGIEIAPARQSRVDLLAATDGVLRVAIAPLGRINRIDPLEVFTLFHGQAVTRGRTVASVKVAPHLVAGARVVEGEAVARAESPILTVDRYLPLEVAAIAAEALDAEARQRFDDAARTKVTALHGRFAGTFPSTPDGTGGLDETGLRALLEELAVRRRLPLLLIGGVSAGDPLAPFYPALAALGGSLLRRGIPAHPGSMIWLARLGESSLLGLPQCGMFTMATAADLVLPRLMTGEQVTADTLADMGHGGLLGPEMRFRFPDYARNLAAPA